MRKLALRILPAARSRQLLFKGVHADSLSLTLSPHLPGPFVTSGCHGVSKRSLLTHTQPATGSPWMRSTGSRIFVDAQTRFAHPSRGKRSLFTHGQPTRPFVTCP